MAEHTEYNCWSGEETQVNCLHCDHDFNVHCEHQGYTPSIGNFDMDAFMKVHKVNIPEGISSIFVRHYLLGYIDDGRALLVVDKEDQKYNKKWLDAHKFAVKEWDRIKKEMANDSAQK